MEIDENLVQFELDTEKIIRNGQNVTDICTQIRKYFLDNGIEDKSISPDELIFKEKYEHFNDEVLSVSNKMYHENHPLYKYFKIYNPSYPKHSFVFDISKESMDWAIEWNKEKQMHDEATALGHAKREGIVEGRTEVINQMIEAMRKNGISEEQVQMMLKGIN